MCSHRRHHQLSRYHAALYLIEIVANLSQLGKCECNFVILTVSFFYKTVLVLRSGLPGPSEKKPKPLVKKCQIASKNGKQAETGLMLLIVMVWRLFITRRFITRQLIADI